MAVMRRGFRREIDALAEIFRFLGDFVDEAAIDEHSAYCLNLVVEELFTNFVRHNAGGGDEITVSLERVDDRLLLGLVDSDVEPFDPDGVPEPPVAKGIGERHPGGLGLHLVRAMVDDLNYEYESETRQMRVSATKRLEK